MRADHCGPFPEDTDKDRYDAFDLLAVGVIRLVRATELHLSDGGGTIVDIPLTR